MSNFWTHSHPDGRTLRAEVIRNQLYLSDSEGTEYDNETYMVEANRDIAAAVQLFFRAETEDAAGFGDEDDEGVVVGDEFWDYLRARANTGRLLRVETFGNKFKQYKNYAGVEKRFNALVINSQKPKHVDLRHARGTNPEVQKCVMAGKRFQEVMVYMVDTIEHDNLQSVGIYCRAGHHRSVACGELLKKHVYPKALVKHLTINR